MFAINKDMSIHVTRGDTVAFAVAAAMDGESYVFKEGDIVRIKVFERKNCDAVVLQKDFAVSEETTTVPILLAKEDTKFGDTISKPTEYWYEVELNPFTDPQTIIGYDEDGAKIFKLFPEGGELAETVSEEDIPVVDKEIDSTSERPVQNQAIARALLQLAGDNEEVLAAREEILEKASEFESMKLDLSNYLPKTGGRIKGILYLGDVDLVEQVLWMITQLRKLNIQITTDGDFVIQDETNSKNIMKSTSDGTNSFNGTSQQAISDGNGNVITATYKTKAESANLIISDTPLTEENSVRVW